MWLSRFSARFQNQTAQGIPLPAPVGGWNARDALDAMDPRDAVILTNWWPRQGDVVTRGGSSVYCNTGETSAVDTLVEHNAGTNRKLIAGCNGKLLNVSTSSPSTLATGFTNNRWATEAFYGYTFFVNGADTPQVFDGSSVSAASFSGSGLTVANLNHVIGFKNRLYFPEKNTQNFWYGSTSAVSGTLTKFQLGQTGNFGGNITALGHIPVDGGSGADDLFAVLLSSGDTVLYQGNDPGDSDAWSLVGVFRLGSLISRDAIAVVGGDLACITRDGFIPLQKVLPFARALSANTTISDKISKAASSAIASYASQTGWRVFLYPKLGALIFNVPITSNRIEQYAFNLQTQAWSKWQGMNARSWSLFNDHAYFGGTNGKVYKADDGYSDAGTAITCDAQTAWTDFGDPGTQKSFTAARPIFQSRLTPDVAMRLGVDFDISIPTAPVSETAVTSSSIWDQVIWDQATWADAVQTARSWSSIAAQMGYKASLRLRTVVSDRQVSWTSTNFIVERGGLI